MLRADSVPCTIHGHNETHCVGCCVERQNADHAQRDEAVDTEDADPLNMRFRAGWLLGLASRLGGDDRTMLLRAARSLVLAADLTSEKKP